MLSSARNRSHTDSFGHRASKTTSRRRERSFRERDRLGKAAALPQQQQLHRQQRPLQPLSPPTKSFISSAPTSPSLKTPVITVAIGPGQRLFAAHEGVLCKSPFLADACLAQPYDATGNKRVDLPDEEPSTFSTMLEYLYKGDYRPVLAWDDEHGIWHLDDEEGTVPLINMHHDGEFGAVLKDTLIYCTAARYRLPELQRLALKKQGLLANVACEAVLSSARFAYARSTPADARLRAHYLATIIRGRATFKRSGSLEAHMFAGASPLFFDLFVALVNHLDDVTGVKKSLKW